MRPRPNGATAGAPIIPLLMMGVESAMLEESGLRVPSGAIPTAGAIGVAAIEVKPGATPSEL